MTEPQLTQHELEALSAWMDRELTGESADRVAHKVRTDPAWQRELRRLESVDRALDYWTAPPAPDGLAERIVQASRRQRGPASPVLSWVRWVVPPAAAAAVLLVGMLVGPFATSPELSPGPSQGTSARPGSPSQPPPAAVDKLVAENLDFFEQYDVVSNLDLLEAIGRQERSQQGS
jgi:anti-sigma factor RsiW